MNRSWFRSLALLAALTAPVAAQSAPNSVFIEALTWEEIRDEIAAGKTTIIIPTAGTEQKGPHMAMGEHKFVMEYTMDQVARVLGNALVSPIMTYVPEGNWGDDASGHMRMPGTITLPEDWFREVLVHTAKSHAAGGFTDIVFIGDSGGNQRGMSAVTDQLNQEWAGTGVRAHFIGDYYAKSSEDITAYLKARGYTDDQIGSHAGMTDTSQMLFVNPQHVRMERAAPGGGFEGSGVSGDPTRATAALGEAQLRIKIDNALAQIRASIGSR
jgi:creatinine amidohydrolase/Fe(II)-dependent formamide hydrolase-like protein